MADYKDIVGTTVRSNAGVLTSAKDGELFYDATNLNFIYRNQNITSAGTWRTGGNMNTARRNLAAAGTQTAALGFGGRPPAVAHTEEYNGSTWTEQNNLNTARGELAGGGTQTSALAFGGFLSPPDTMYALNESYNGTSWTEVADLNTARLQLAGAGADATSAIAFAGYDIPSAVAIAEVWNGSGWTEVGDLSTARTGLAGTGTTTSALASSGTTGTRTAATEEWNSSSILNNVLTD